MRKRRIQESDQEIFTELEADETATSPETENIFLDRPAAAPHVEVDAEPADEEREASSAQKERADAGATAYTLYLREIGQTKLISPAEEIQLAKRIQRGDDAARDLMIRANLRLVVKIAREYEDYGVPLLDLINEGNMGLMKAVERFDPGKGAKLSTYAAWWIKQAIRRALSNQSKTIRLPVHVGDKLLHMRRAAAKMEELLGREPTIEELAEELGMAPARVASLRNAAVPPSSLDAPVGEDGKRFDELVGDEKADSPYDHLEDKTTNSLLAELLLTLPDREQTILRYRFGLDGEGEKTLEQVGEKFGVTRERIRQIQNLALAKLRKMIEKREAVHLAA